MGKQTICIGENKGENQLRSNCEAYQRLCFRCSDHTILLLLKNEISSFQLASVTVQAGLCQTLKEPKLLVFSRTSSYVYCQKGLAVNSSDLDHDLFIYFYLILLFVFVQVVSLRK